MDQYYIVSFTEQLCRTWFFLGNTPGDTNPQDILYLKLIVQDVQGTCMEAYYKYLNGIHFLVRERDLLGLWKIKQNDSCR